MGPPDQYMPKTFVVDDRAWRGPAPPPDDEAGGVAIYQQDAKFSAIFENTLLSSRSRRRLESALNKLADGTGPAPGLAVLGKLPRGSPVVAALIDDKRFLDELLAQSRDSKGRSLKGNLRRHLDIGARDFDWATLRGTLGIKVLSGQMQFGLAESTDPERMRDSVERLFLEFVRHFLNENLTFENKSKLVDHSIEVLFRLENLRSYWRKQLR